MHATRLPYAHSYLIVCSYTLHVSSISLAVELWTFLHHAMHADIVCAWSVLQNDTTLLIIVFVRPFETFDYRVRS